MKRITMLFICILIAATIYTQYAFFWFNEHVTDKYPLGKFPDSYYHYTHITQHDSDVAKYIGTHIIFYPLLATLPPLMAFGFSIPILYVFILPFSVFLMAREYSESTHIGALAALLLMFGTDVVTTILQIAVWPQGLNMLLTALAITTGIRYMRTKQKRFIVITIMLLLWSALAHLKFSIASLAIAMLFLAAHKRYLELFLATLATSFTMFMLHEYYQFTLVSDYFFINPKMLLFTVFPLNFLFGLYGLHIMRKKDQWIHYTLFIPLLASAFLLFIEPNFRLYLHMLMFMSPFMAIGMVKALQKVKHSSIQRLLATGYVLLMLAYFSMFCMYLTYVDVIYNAHQHANVTLKEELEQYFPKITFENGTELQRLRSENKPSDGVSTGL